MGVALLLVGRDLRSLCPLLGLSIGTGGHGWGGDSPFPSPVLAERVPSKERSHVLSLWNWREGSHRSERLGDGGDAGRAQGCWSFGQGGERGWGTASPGHSSHWLHMTPLLLDSPSGCWILPFPQPEPTSPGQVPHSPAHPGSCGCWVPVISIPCIPVPCVHHCDPWHSRFWCPCPC